MEKTVKIFDEEKIKRREAGECYFLCGRNLQKEGRKLVGKETYINCC
jgi:hypothetical protein